MYSYLPAQSGNSEKTSSHTLNMYDKLDKGKKMTKGGSSVKESCHFASVSSSKRCKALQPQHANMR